MCDLQDSSFDIALNKDKKTDASASSPTASASVGSGNESGPSSVASVVLPLLCGGVFGAMFQSSRVHELVFIRAQMKMERFLMLKMFLSAASTSILVLALMPLVSSRARRRVAEKTKAVSSGMAQSRGLVSVALGASMLGAGMALSGSCPGTVFAQLAAGSRLARSVLAGGLLGAFVYPLLDHLPGWDSLLRAGRAPKIQNATVASALGVPAYKVALPLAAGLLSLVAVLEWLSPWQQELKSGVLFPAGSAVPGAIPPYVAGMAIGLLQAPLLLGVGQMLGSSSSYVTVVANAVGALVGGKKLERLAPSWSTMRRGAFPLFQVMLMAGVFLGAYASSSLSGARFLSEAGGSAAATTGEALLGGFLLVFGARLAGGCTSGHGISGFGLLALNSAIAVPAMFATGIAVANLRG